MTKFFNVIGVLFACSFLYLAHAQIFKEACLKAHNRFRSLHGVPEMVLDDELQAYALEWARYLASTGKFEHRNPPKYGENIYGAYGASGVTGYNATLAWYREIEDYDYDNPGFSMATGHFTQVVWKTSVKLGCGFAKNGTTTIVVASYYEPGNVSGRFPQNVPRPIN